MTDVPRLTRCRLTLPGGAQLTACSVRCLRRLHATVLGHGPADVDTAPRSPHRGCVHCSWCGELVAAPQRCHLHDSCPPFRWDVTETGRQAVADVLADQALSTLSPRAFAAFAQVADYLRDAGGFPDRAALVGGVLDRRVDWLPWP